jgi:hypothetical protein
MANWYNQGLSDIADGSKPWATASDIRVLACTSSYTFDNDHDTVSQITNEITNTNYARTALTGETVIIDDANNEVQLDANNVTYTALAAGNTPSQMISYTEAGTDATRRLMTRNALTSPPAPNGGDYTIVWDSEGLGEFSN